MSGAIRDTKWVELNAWPDPVLVEADWATLSELHAIH